MEEIVATNSFRNLNLETRKCRFIEENEEGSQLLKWAQKNFILIKVSNLYVLYWLPGTTHQSLVNLSAVYKLEEKIVGVHHGITLIQENLVLYY